MLAATLQTVTGATSVRGAWDRLLRADDIVALKFNKSGQFVIGTTTLLASTLIESLVVSGIEPDRIMCLEAPPGVAERFGCRPPRMGYDAEATSFASGSDQLLRALGDVTALINVPFLKDHNIAGLSCALKNLSHGLIKHPARYHADGCSPFVADIVALPAIRGKLRLNLVDALRVVYHGGPEATSHNVADLGMLMASEDPVAVDSVGVQIINDVRERLGMSHLVAGPQDIAYLAAAHDRGLGVAVSHGIDVERTNL